VKSFGFPLAIAAIQLGVGLLYAIPLWVVGIRKMPKVTFDDMLLLLPIGKTTDDFLLLLLALCCKTSFDLCCFVNVALLNAGGHACAVIAMFQVGGGSFTHVIKASEPVVSVILGLFINGAVPKPLTALSLLPITYGVAYASTLGQLDVSTMSRELGTMAAK
jgi:solute carrier family 35, member E1